MRKNRIEIGIILFGVCLVFLTGCSIFSNEKINEASKDENIAEIEKNNYDFPKDWLGRWSGELEIYDYSGLKQTLPMMALNLPTENPGTYSWALVYGEDTIAGKRDYLLQTIDEEKGIYQVDEQNGIFLDGYHIHDEFISVFEVMGNKIISTYRILGEEMEFKILMYKSESHNTTGDTIINGEEVPVVRNFPVKITQKAILTKM